MTTNLTIPIWIMIGGLLAIGIGYCVYKILIKDRIPPKRGITNDIMLDLNPIIKYFSGNMNALLDISKNPDLSFAKVTFDNIHQIFDVKGSNKIKIWYKNFEKDRSTWDTVLYKGKAKELLNILVKYGIHSKIEQEFVWDNDSSMKYNKLSKIQIGQECIVVVPYWIFNGEIFEKGLVKAK